MLPLVSIIIPIYNRESTVQRAVDSVLNQTYANIEVIVVDDGSVDGSVKMLEKYYNDERVKVFCQKSNKGANAARNRGIREAKGKYIAFQDSDDVWLSTKLERQIKKMETENFYVSFCAFKRHYSQAIQIVPNISETLSSESIKEKLKTSNMIGTPTLVINREVVAKIGMFDEDMPRLQDYEFVIRAVKEFNICYINEPLVLEYQMEGCISLNQKSLQEAYILLLKKHSDFLDIEYIWGKYLEIANVIADNSINWNELNEIMDSIVRLNNNCTRSRLYQATIKYLNEKYLRIKDYEKQQFDDLLSKLKNKEFVVYGAGFYGRQVADLLWKRKLIPECFLVTTKDGTENINNTPVIQLSEWNKGNQVVIIAVSGVASKKIIQNLKEKGIDKYYIYPDCI